MLKAEEGQKRGMIRAIVEGTQAGEGLSLKILRKGLVGSAEMRTTGREIVHRGRKEATRINLKVLET